MGPRVGPSSCSPPTRRSPSPSRTAMPRRRGRPWRPSSTTSSVSSTRAWPSSMPSAIESRSWCSAPPGPWTPRSADRGSTGSTPPSCREPRSGTTSSWTTSPRASRLARTEPQGPVYLCLDAALQEEALERAVPLPDVARFQPATPPHADPRAIDDAARRLADARYPVIVVENLGRRPGVAASLCRLAELLAAPLVDLSVEYQGRPSVPGRHPLDMSGARDEVVREADLILALDVSNFLGALGHTDRSTREVRLLNESARVISISLEDYAARSWAQTYQALIPVDLPVAADAALALPTLVEAVEDRLRRDRAAAERRARAERIALRHAALSAEWQAAVSLERSSMPLAPSVLAAEVWQVIKDEDWILANGTGKGWARRLWDWQPERACGGSGGAGLGYGLPAALGVTLAHRDSGKLCVNLQADGDLLYVVSGLYTAAHHRLPLLTVMFNNRTYGNDEEHQEAVAKTRGRPAENQVVGIRIDDPAPQ